MNVDMFYSGVKRQAEPAQEEESIRPALLFCMITIGIIAIGLSV